MTSRPARSEATIVVGRSSARRVAEGWLELAGEGLPRVGILRGGPGVGRSALLRVVATQAEQQGFTVLRATPPSPPGPPLLPVIAMLAPLLDQMRAGRRQDLSADEHDALAVLLRDNATAPSTHARRRGSDDTQRFLAASRLLLGVARSRPVLLAVDDAQALDDASAELLAHLVATAAHAAEDVWPVEILWKCPNPWFEGWVTWRQHGTGTTEGQVTVILATPAEDANPVVDVAALPPGATTPLPEPTALPPDERGMWVVTHHRHVKHNVDVMTPLPDGSALDSLIDAVAALLGLPQGQWSIPVPSTTWEGTGGVDVVHVPEPAGGAAPFGATFPA